MDVNGLIIRAIMLIFLLDFQNRVFVRKMALIDTECSRNRHVSFYVPHENVHRGRYTLVQSVNKAKTINNRAVFRQDPVHNSKIPFRNGILRVSWAKWCNLVK